ncbi:MAG: lysophospholipid acyltransferase family protein [Syntrophomonadaceae bacterium]|jgi:1-acyl-sn-glycerol-3-phosphate acyltransferase
MLYRCIRMILKVIFWPLGLKSEGLNNIPSTGPVIIASNHVSNWDPVMVAISIQRTICFIAKAELFSNIILNKLFRKLHAFPVKRGTADRRAIKEALDILAQGKVLGIFPEGQRHKSNTESKAHAGIAMLALKSQAPVVPVACIGTGRKFPCGWFSPLLVRVGKPMYWQEYQGQKINSATMEKISSEIMKEINILLSK